MQVGFVGLGTMGRGMAANLLRAGHAVQVWNRSPEPVEELVAQGATAAPDLAAVFANDVVLSMLPDDAVIGELLLDEGLLAGASASVHVNMATVSVDFARHAAALHARHGIGYVAAPVLGRGEVAAAGRLTVLAAGDPALLDRLAPLFDAIGQRTWRQGDQPHLANTAKIASNYLIACAIESLSEACALAEAGGVDPSGLVEMLNNSLFPGAVYGGYGAMVAEQRYEPAGFRLPLGLKDVRLALEVGAEHHVPLPFGSVLRDAFLDALAHGDTDRDWSAIAAVTRRRAALPLR